MVKEELNVIVHRLATEYNGQVTLVENGCQQILCAGTELTFSPWNEDLITEQFGHLYFRSNEGILISPEFFCRRDVFTNLNIDAGTGYERLKNFISNIWMDHSLGITVIEGRRAGRNNSIIVYRFRIDQCILDEIEEKRQAQDRYRLEQENRRLREQREQREREEKERLSDFNYVNRNSRDAILSFDARTHSYCVNGIHFLGVTKFISSFFPAFEEDRIAREVANKRGVNPNLIKEEWAKEAFEGTELHKNIDLYLHGKPVNNSGTDFKLFLDFLKDNPLNPYRTEWNIFDEDSEVAGALDLLDYSNGRFTMYDWKRSKNLIDQYGPIKHNRFEERFAFYPISYIEDLPFWHYALQQNIYRYILKKKYDIDVKRMKLVVLHPSLTTPQIIDVPKMDEEIEKLINTR